MGVGCFVTDFLGEEVLRGRSAGGFVAILLTSPDHSILLSPHPLVRSKEIIKNLSSFVDVRPQKPSEKQSRYWSDGYGLNQVKRELLFNK
jgi:hypothetical protein